MNVEGLKYKGIKVIIAATVIGSGVYSMIPQTFAATNAESDMVQTPIGNELSNLSIDGITLEQSFSPTTFSYHATVLHDVGAITLQLDGFNQNEKITINGNTINDPKNIPLDVQTGDNLFTIGVDDGVNTPVTYTLIVTKEQSDNNLLKNIKLSTGKLSFDSAVTEYNVQVPNEIQSLTVTPEVFEATEKVKINGILLSGIGQSVKLPVGKSNILIEVTAENGATKNYVLHVARGEKEINQAPGGKPTSNNNTKPSSNNNTKPSSNITKKTSTNESTKPRSNFGNGSRSSTIPTNMGMTFTSGKQTQGTQTQVKASQAQLSSLTVSTGTWNKAFSKDAYTYHIKVGSSVKSIVVNATARTSGATISIEGGNQTIQLGDNAKKTIISVIVKKDDEQKTYVLVFDKTVVGKATVSDETVVTSTSSDVDSISNIQTSKTSVDNHIQYMNRNNTEQSASWWKRLWKNIKDLF